MSAAVAIISDNLIWTKDLLIFSNKICKCSFQLQNLLVRKRIERRRVKDTQDIYKENDSDQPMVKVLPVASLG